MRARTLAVYLLATLALGTACLLPQTSGAQYGYGGGGPLSPGEIVDNLADEGFDEITRPRLNGPVYLVTATGPRGLRLNLVLDAYDGRILRRQVLRYEDPPLIPPRDVGVPGLRSVEPPPQARAWRGAPLYNAPDDVEDRAALPMPPGAVYSVPVPPPGMPPLREAARPPPGEDMPSQPAPSAPQPSRRPPKAVSTTDPLVAPPAAKPAEVPRLEPKRAPAANTLALPPAAALPAPKAAPPAPAAPDSAAQPQAGQSRTGVRIIGGVTPVLPRGDADKNN
jgi:hypothetical protein